MPHVKEKQMGNTHWRQGITLTNNLLRNTESNKLDNDVKRCHYWYDSPDHRTQKKERFLHNTKSDHESNNFQSHKQLQ
jgi:hypothetical protein